MADADHVHHAPLDTSEVLLDVTVQVGERLYQDLKKATPGDAARLLRGYADRSTGAERAAFLLLAEWHGVLPLVPLREAPDPNKANATGGSGNISVGLCGTGGCSQNQMPVYYNGIFQYCAACVITG
jgi:hypothetical protein